MSEEARLRANIAEVGRRLYAKGFIAGNEGNVSVVTDPDGRPTGGARATSEILMHAAVYRQRPDVGAVVHAHPPVATGSDHS